MQERLVELEKAVLASEGSLQGINRNIAASLSSIADQLQTVLQIKNTSIGSDFETFVISSVTGASSPQPRYYWGSPNDLVIPEGFDYVSVNSIFTVGGRFPSDCSPWGSGLVYQIGSDPLGYL